MDDKKRTARYWMAFLILAVFLVILFVWNVNAGSIHLSVGEILNIIFRHQGDATAYNIIWEIRLPRILSVIILGGALSVSGFLLQTFFNNPIAGPFVLGISSGAKLVVALLMIYFLSRSISMGSAAMIIAAFIGSMISMGFVLLVAKKVHNMSMLVISGVMIGYICSAVTDFVVTFADDSNIVNLHNWSLGSFSGMSWGNVKVMAIVVLLTMVIVFFMSKPIGAYQLGEVYAQNMGVNIKLFRIGLILLSSILIRKGNYEICNCRTDVTDHDTMTLACGYSWTFFGNSRTNHGNHRTDKRCNDHGCRTHGNRSAQKRHQVQLPSLAPEEIPSPRDLQ